VLPVLTPAEMAAADARTIEAGTPLEELMDRAARAVARAAKRLLGGTYGHSVVVVAGKGHNGGDGEIAAGHLQRAGIPVRVFRLEDELDRAVVERAIERADLVIDAMYGTGFRGALRGDAAWVAETCAARDVPVLAVDIPSGVDGLTGAAPGAAVGARATVTFAALKPGLLFEPGRTLAGDVEVVDMSTSASTSASPPTGRTCGATRRSCTCWRRPTSGPAWPPVPRTPTSGTPGWPSSPVRGGWSVPPSSCRGPR
jgi:NAD(P)H-hydrate epimerase